MCLPNTDIKDKSLSSAVLYNHSAFNQKLRALIRVTTFKADFNKKVIFNSLLKANSIIFPYSGC